MIEIKVSNTAIESRETKNLDFTKDTHDVLESRTTNGFTNPEGTVQNIGILKNASTYFDTEAQKQGWTFQSIPYKQQITRFVILRDPYERYVSGLAEDLDRYLTLNNDKQAFIKKIYTDNLAFDFFDFLFDLEVFELGDHTHLQTKILQFTIKEIGVENMTFIKLTDTLGDSINQFLHGQNCKTNFSNIKMHEKSLANQSFLPLAQYYFAHIKNKKRKENLLHYLWPDYKFMNSINFFNKY